MCPNCSSNSSTFLGRLGAVIWLRCRMCGTDFEGNPNTYPMGRID